MIAASSPTSDASAASFNCVMSPLSNASFKTKLTSSNLTPLDSNLFNKSVNSGATSVG